jgi:hypothetical protein
MESNQQRDRKNIKKLGKQADEALRKATREALKKHRLAGNPIAVWRDGKVIILEPHEITP